MKMPPAAGVAPHPGRHTQAKVLSRTERAPLPALDIHALRRLGDLVPFALWAVRADASFAFSNRAASDYFGSATLFPESLETIHPDDVAPFLATWTSARERGCAWDLDVRLRRRDGTHHRHRVFAAPEEESASIWLFSAENLDWLDSERAARMRAEAANRKKDELLATISHELRTPLHAIMGWTHLLQRGDLDPATSTRALTTIERNASAQARLISDLLDISRITTGKIHLEERPVEMGALVTAAVDSLEPEISAKGIAVDVLVEAPETPVFADPSRMQQIVVNLLTNAIKFSSSRVEVALSSEDDAITLSVSDDGQGIHADFLPHVFDRFQQADRASTRTHGGLGLGLAIVKNLVHLHRGTVHAESAGEGRGATFRARFPLRRDPPSRLRADSWSERGTNLQGARVLVVDDEEDARELLAVLLERTGAIVQTASSVAEAFLHVQKAPPDAMVSDIGMPNEDGYTLIRRIRANGGRYLPAIALTAYASTEDRMRALEAGFDRHLTKPVDHIALTQTIGNLLWLAAQDPVAS